MISFAHVGLHKTASTWLQSCVFKHHPQLQVIGANEQLRELEIQIALLAATDESELDLQKWKRNFEKKIPFSMIGDSVLGVTNEDLSGNMITGHYASLVADRLRVLFGPIKILLILRHPVSYIRSAHIQYVKAGGALPLRTLLTDPTIPGKALARKIEYHKLVTCYQSRFGKSNVLVLPYELLDKSQEQFLGYIWRFLGVKEIGSATLSRGRSNVALSPISLKLMRLTNYLGFDRRFMRRILQKLDRRLLRRLPVLNSSPLTADFLRQFKGGPIYRGFDGILLDENYKIWNGELSEFNYKF